MRTDLSHDPFLVCEECVALVCDNGITPGLKLEVLFVVSAYSVLAAMTMRVTHIDIAAVLYPSMKSVTVTVHGKKKN